MIVHFLTEAKERSLLYSCSTDKGFYTSENRKKLDRLLDLNLMPKKGVVTRRIWSEKLRRPLWKGGVSMRRLNPGSTTCSTGGWIWCVRTAPTDLPERWLWWLWRPTCTVWV